MIVALVNIIYLIKIIRDYEEIQSISALFDIIFTKLHIFISYKDNIVFLYIYILYNYVHWVMDLHVAIRNYYL